MEKWIWESEAPEKIPERSQCARELKEANPDDTFKLLNPKILELCPLFQGKNPNFPRNQFFRSSSLLPI
jgi:hypothetical protein